MILPLFSFSVLTIMGSIDTYSPHLNSPEKLEIRLRSLDTQWHQIPPKFARKRIVQIFLRLVRKTCNKQFMFSLNGNTETQSPIKAILKYAAVSLRVEVTRPSRAPSAQRSLQGYSSAFRCSGPAHTQEKAKYLIPVFVERLLQVQPGPGN